MKKVRRYSVFFFISLTGCFIPSMKTAHSLVRGNSNTTFYLQFYQDSLRAEKIAIGGFGFNHRWVAYKKMEFGAGLAFASYGGDWCPIVHCDLKTRTTEEKRWTPAFASNIEIGVLSFEPWINGGLICSKKLFFSEVYGGFGLILPPSLKYWFGMKIPGGKGLSFIKDSRLIFYLESTSTVYPKISFEEEGWQTTRFLSAGIGFRYCRK